MLKSADKLRETLRAAGRPITSQRQQVWEALNTKQDHPTAAELHARCPDLPLATVYNTLDLFTELGLVHSLVLDGIARYDVDTNEHINVICSACGSVTDVALQLPNALREWVRLESGFELSHPRVDWYGLCPTCKTKKQLN